MRISDWSSDVCSSDLGEKRRIRADSSADHYSQARQFYISQTEVERGHIAAALTFELSKVETPAIRAPMVSHLLNIDKDLANKVATGLRLKDMPSPPDAARPTRMDLAPQADGRRVGNERGGSGRSRG